MIDRIFGAILIHWTQIIHMFVCICIAGLLFFTAVFYLISLAGIVLFYIFYAHVSNIVLNFKLSSLYQDSDFISLAIFDRIASAALTYVLMLSICLSSIKSVSKVLIKTVP